MFVLAARQRTTPSWRLHELKGSQAGRWSITVNGNWGPTFTLEGTDVGLLAKAPGTSPEFWYGMQVNYDLWQAKKKFRGKVRPIVQRESTPA
jgi:hypothetical protein